MRKNKIAMMLTTEVHEGGEHQYALLMADCLKSLSGSRYELIAICTNSFWSKWCEKNHIKYTRIGNWFWRREIVIAWNLYFPMLSRLYYTYMTKLGQTVRKERVDILFLTRQLIYVPNLKVKIITPVHDLMHRYEPTFSEVTDEWMKRDMLFKCQAKYADYILTDSKLGTKQFIDSYLKQGKRRPYVISLPFIVSEHIFEVKEEYIDVPARYVFYPAQFWKHKNHLNLIKAIQILKGSIEDIHLVLVGSEKGCRAEIENYISQHQLKNEVTILGFVSNENITYLYRHAVGMIMPSYFGPTNIPPLEAMALGCPVAVSNKYAMPEQVGEAGLLFDPDSPEEIADCIRRLWTEDDLRKKMIQKGYQKIGEWTKADFKDRVRKVIEHCMME